IHSIFRYLRTIVHAAVFYLARRQIELPEKQTFTAQNVSVIVPTVACPDDNDRLRACLRSIVTSKPAAIYVVTATHRLSYLEWIAVEEFEFAVNIQVLGAEKLNKRVQMWAALRQTTTELVVFADDNVFWPNDYLQYLTHAFEDPDVGGAGTLQRLKRHEKPSFFHFLGTSYLERRNFNTVSPNMIDGAISTLSGRTSAFRKSVFDSETFELEFLNDSWKGKPLNEGDDKFLTRWVYKHDWKIRLIADERAILETELDCGLKYFSQCMRWSRGHWRGNFRVMKMESYWYRKHVWSLYATYLGQFQTPSLLFDGVLTYMLYLLLLDYSSLTVKLSMIVWITWVLLTKVIKLIPHLTRYPSDLKYLPAAILFAYFHGLLNVYALLTLQNTCWGNRNLSHPSDEKAIMASAFEASSGLEKQRRPDIRSRKSFLK
ncbi:hypothetical protein BT63DRAFT_377929, partial [Microthyrium microscopicum]